MIPTDVPAPPTEDPRTLAIGPGRQGRVCAVGCDATNHTSPSSKTTAETRSLHSAIRITLKRSVSADLRSAEGRFTIRQDKALLDHRDPQALKKGQEVQRRKLSSGIFWTHTLSWARLFFRGISFNIWYCHHVLLSAFKNWRSVVANNYGYHSSESISIALRYII